MAGRSRRDGTERRGAGSGVSGRSVQGGNSVANVTGAAGGIGARRSTARGERAGSAATQGSKGPRGGRRIGDGAEGGASSAATSGGIGAKADRSGSPAADAATAARNRRGKQVGTGNAQSATGDGYTPHFGVGGQGGGSGSPRPSSQRRSRGRGPNTAMPTVQDLSDYTPRTTFADSTIKRGDGKRSPTKSKRIDPDGDGDNDATPSGDTDHDYWSPDGKQLKPLPGQDSNPMPSGAKKAADADTMAKGSDSQMRRGRRTANSQSRVGPADDYASQGVASPGNHLSDGQKPFPKGGIIKPSRKGLFTAKAKKAGMSVQAYAASVLANKDSHDPATVRQANFARNFGGGR